MWYRKLSQEDGKKAIMSSKWEEGLWLGHCRNSNEVWIGTPAGAVKAWSVRRRVAPERWDRHFMMKVKAVPEDPQVLNEKRPDPKPDGTIEDEEPATEEEEEEAKRRYLRLRAKDFAKYGYSDECAGCARMRRGAKPPYRHNGECRRRLEKAIRRDDRPRWERYEIRRPVGDPACSSPAESSDEETKPEIAAAPSDDHGFPMVSPLVERLMQVDVAEMYSPPRVTTQATKFGLKSGEAFDLTTGWDFSQARQRDEARHYVEKQKPLVVIGSPPCTPFSQLQSLNPDTPQSREKWTRGSST